MTGTAVELHDRVTIPDHAPQAPRRLTWITRAPETCPRCHKQVKALTYSRPGRTWRCARCAPRVCGQSLVEFALVLPIMMFTILGGIEAGFLFAHQHGYQNGADVLAAWSAAHEADAPGGSGFSEGAPGAPWQSVVASEASRTSCDGSPSVSWPDGRAPGDRVRVDVTCHYTPQATSNLWPGGLDVSVQAEAVIPGSTPAPSPSPEPSPEPSPSP